MSTSDSQNPLHATGFVVRPPRPPLIWSTDSQVLRALRGHDRFIIRILVDEITGLGLAIRRNPLGGWSSKQFKINTPEQLAFDGCCFPSYQSRFLRDQLEALLDCSI